MPDNSPFVDAIESFKSHQDATQSKPVLNAQEAINSITDPIMKNLVTSQVTKAIQSTDLQGIRLVSLYDQVGMLVNEQTVFRSIAEKNGIFKSTDFQIRWPEEYAGAGNVAFFNLNTMTNPTEDQMNRGVRTNTMGAYGWTLNIPFIVDALAGQSPVTPQDIKMREVRMGIARMRRFSNAKLLANKEITAETGAIPQWGGLVTRSTSYNVATTGDVTDALIQGRVDAIANATSNNGLGYQKPLLALCGSSAQMSILRYLMINRFPGENSQSYMATQEQLEALGLKGVVVPAQTRVYQPDPGLPIVFIHEPQLDANTILFFDPSQVQIAKFALMGSLGPFIVERYTSTLNRLYVCLDFESLVDLLVPSRALITGIN